MSSSPAGSCLSCGTSTDVSHYDIGPRLSGSFLENQSLHLTLCSCCKPRQWTTWLTEVPLIMNGMACYQYEIALLAWINQLPLPAQAAIWNDQLQDGPFKTAEQWMLDQLNGLPEGACDELNLPKEPPVFDPKTCDQHLIPAHLSRYLLEAQLVKQSLIKTWDTPRR